MEKQWHWCLNCGDQRMEQVMEYPNYILYECPVCGWKGKSYEVRSNSKQGDN